MSTLKFLTQHNLDLNITTKNGRSALHVACLHSNLDIAQFLVDNSLNVNATDSCGNTPLHDATLAASLPILRYLTSKNANIRAKNKEGFTILHLAACEGHLEIIEFILDELRFDVNIGNDNGLTPLHCSARTKRKSAYDLLISRGADEGIVDKFGRKASDYLYI